MKKEYITSDLHLLHERIIKNAERTEYQPFSRTKAIQMSWDIVNSIHIFWSNALDQRFITFARFCKNNERQTPQAKPCFGQSRQTIYPNNYESRF